MRRPLRIAIFVGGFPVLSETFILRQIIGLLDLGNDVEVFADTRPEPEGPVQPEIAKYKLTQRTIYMDMPPETAPWEMPVWPISGRTWPPGSTTPVRNIRRVARALPTLCRCLATVPRLTFQALSPAEYLYQASSLSALYRLAKLSAHPRRFDVLHAHFGPVGNSFRFARKLWQAPLVVSFHGYDFSTAPRKEGAGMYQKLFQTADAVTVNSAYTAARVEKLECPPIKIHRLPVGLDPNEFPFRERSLKAGEPLRILTVGRLVEIKGHEFAIRAVGRLRLQHPSVGYDIVGDGPLRSRLEKLIGELGLQQTVRLRGALGGAEVKRLLSEAHLFLLASVSVEGDQEGQGLVLQEAQAAGLPLVATNHGAFPEGLVAGQSGFLVPERDTPALAERLHHLAQHPETWPAMGRAGRKFVEEHFDVRKLNLQLMELYETTIEAYSRVKRTL